MELLVTQNSKDAYEGLVSAIAGENTLVLVGAGSSQRLGYPNWEQLIATIEAYAKTLHNYSEIHNEDLTYRADKLQDIVGLENFKTKVAEIFKPQEKMYDEFHQLLVKLPFKYFLTTNYDTVIQEAYKATHSKVIKSYDHSILESSEIKQILQNEPVIIHLHGSIQKPNTIILSERDYSNLYTHQKYTKKLECIFNKYNIVFIGFSLNDPDIAKLLKEGRRCTGGASEHYAIIELKNDEDENKVRAAWRSSYSIEPIFYENKSGDHRQLKEIIQNLDERVASTIIQNEKSRLFILTQKHDIIKYLPTSIVQAMSGIADEQNPLDRKISKICENLIHDPWKVINELHQIDDSTLTTPHLKYRVYANLGNAFLNVYDNQRAAQEYYKAYNAEPETENSKALKLFALVLEGKDHEAWELANDLKTKISQLPRIYSSMVKVCPDDYDFKRMRFEIPPKMRRDSEVAVALAYLAEKRNLYKWEEHYLRLAVNNSPDWIEAKQSLACFIFNEGIRNSYFDPAQGYMPEFSDKIKEAETLLTDAIRLNGEVNKKRLAYLHYNRYSIRKLLKKKLDAIADLDKSSSLSPEIPEILIAKAFQYASNGDFNTAINMLEKYRKPESDIKLRFMLALFLHQRKQNGDHIKALSLLDNAIKSFSSKTSFYDRYDIVILYAEILIANAMKDEACKFILISVQELLPVKYKNLVILTINSRLGNEIDRSLYKSLETDFEGETRHVVIRDYALLAARIKDYKRAFELFRKIVNPLQLNDDLPRLLTAAKNANEEHYVLDICRGFRERGVYDSFLVDLETNILLDCHEYREFFAILDAYLARNPNDRLMTLKKAHIAILIHDKKNSNIPIEKIPKITEITNANNGSIVLEVLRENNLSEHFKDYAYRLLRKFPNSKEIHQRIVLGTMLGFVPISKFETVCENCAVQYQEIGHLKPKTLIIETDNPSVLFDEYALTQSFVQHLIGKKEGDSFVVHDKEYKIIKIMDKFLFHFFRIRDNLAVNFPNELILKEIHVDLDAPANQPQKRFGELYKFLKEEYEQANSWVQEYSSGKVTIPLLAKTLGKTVIETMQYLILNGNSIQAPYTDVFDKDTKSFINSSKPTIVLDNTAIASIFLNSADAILKQFKCNIIVSETAISELNILIESLEGNQDPQEKLSAYYHKDQILFTESNYQGYIQQIKDLKNIIESECTIVGGKYILDFEPSLRTGIQKCYGTVAADALSIAYKEKFYYCTEDYLLGLIAKNLWNIPSINIQMLLMHGVQKKYLINSELSEITCNMFGNHYLNLHYSVDLLLDCYKRDDWKPNGTQIQALQNEICSPYYPPNLNIYFYIYLIFTIWKSCPWRYNAKILISNLLEKIGRNFSGPNIARKIYRKSLPPELKFAPNSLKNFLRKWRSTNPSSVSKWLNAH